MFFNKIIITNIVKTAESIKTTDSLRKFSLDNYITIKIKNII
jgi:hypothetical protein